MLKRLLAGAAALCLAFAPASADQSNKYAPTSGTLPGLSMVNDYNGALNALDSCNSGASAPANTLSGTPNAGECWLNTSTSPPTVEMYTGAPGNSWVAVGVLDSANAIWTPPVGGGIGALTAGATTNLGSVPQAVVDISGTTPITGFGSSAQIGTLKFLNFSGALTLTYNATSLILPTAANITTGAGDWAVAMALGSGNWQVIAYTRANGTALSGGSTINGAFNLTGIIAPSALGAGGTNNWAPSGLSTASQILATANSAGSTVTGMAAGTAGQRVTIYNIGTTGVLTLTSQDANSTAGNRFLIAAPTGLRPLQSQTFVYDNTSSTKGWRPESHISALPMGGAYKNLKIVNDGTNPTTTMDITADELVVEDVNGLTYRLTNVSVAPVMTASGANGLDTGTIINNTVAFYAEYVIFNPTTNTIAGLYSLSASASALVASGNMPSGYTAAMRVGWERTDGAAGARWMRTLQMGREARFIVTAATNTTDLPTIASGNTSSGASVAESVANFAPSTASKIIVDLFGETNGGGGTQYARVSPSAAYGSTGSGVSPPYGTLQIGGNLSNVVYFEENGAIMLESANIYYASNAMTGSVLGAVGWEDNL